MKLNFKTGFFFGNALGIVLLAIGFIAIQHLQSKAENVANINLHELYYEDLEGNEIKLSNFENKNILINFWATWCGPCIKEFPVLDETYGLLKDDFVFVMVSDESTEKIQRFVDKKPYQFVFLKTNNLLSKGILSVPQTFVLDKEGTTRKHHPSIFEGRANEIANTLLHWVK